MRPELNHGNEDKRAQKHTRMGKREAWGGESDGVNGYEVDIHGSVGIAAVGESVW